MNSVLVKCMMICSNEGFVTLCQQVEGASLTRLFLHLMKDVALLDSGSSMSDLSVVRRPFKVPWCRTVLKQ